MNLGLLKLFLIAIFFSKNLIAEPLLMEYANFKLLDKISNKLSEKTIAVNESDLIETLDIKVYSCFTEPPDEIPEDYVLIDVKDNFLDEDKSIYKGWMISSSPDVTPLEHPIYDLWLLGCSNDKTS
tara:strand:+ start:335 stop:712 length:378 start_codon:yes stop_codon:yes gene_type:complete